MNSFLDRYASGECEAVWAELLNLGAQVRQEPLFSEALAVAHATMKRVRYNIQLLIPRLQICNYEFGYAWLEEYAEAIVGPPFVAPQEEHVLYPQEILEELEGEGRERELAELRERAHRPALPYSPPELEVQSSLDELENLVGPLPLSWHAWYEIVGAVDFVGRTPQGWWDQFQIRTPPDESLDPLQVLPLEQVLKTAKREQPYLDQEGLLYLPVSHDKYSKYYISGSGSYSIRVPQPTMDAFLEGEWHHTTFVNYLRICFRWGGMPGLERCPQIPKKDLTFLTEGLLSL